MFYQHELLSKQKSGLGLVWLLSTIGAKASFGKRVSKKDLLKGDVSKGKANSALSLTYQADAWVQSAKLSLIHLNLWLFA